MIKPLAKLIVALNGNLDRKAIAAAFSWGVFLGLFPAWNPLWVFFFAASFFFKHHHWSKMLVLAVFKIISGAVIPLVDMAGWEFLHMGALQPLFTTLYNMPFVPLTRFNNTLVAGGLVCGLVLWLPVFILVFLLIPLYRNNIAPKIRDTKLVKSVKNLPLIKLLAQAVTAVAESSAS